MPQYLFKERPKRRGNLVFALNSFKEHLLKLARVDRINGSSCKLEPALRQSRSYLYSLIHPLKKPLGFATGLRPCALPNLLHLSLRGALRRRRNLRVAPKNENQIASLRGFASSLANDKNKDRP